VPASPLKGTRVCVLDAYGTLFDYASAMQGCRNLLGNKLEPLTSVEEVGVFKPYGKAYQLAAVDLKSIGSSMETASWLPDDDGNGRSLHSQKSPVW